MLNSNKLSRLRTYGLLVAVLLLAYGLMLGSAGRKSATVDEQSHLFRGVAYLLEGATHFLLGHPLGGSILAALPLLTEPDLTLPLDTPAWDDGNWSVAGSLFLWQINDNPHQLIFLGRLSMMWLTLLLAVFVFRWGRALAGSLAGLVATALLLFDPNILAHGRLITDDIPVTFGFLLTVYGFWGWSQAKERDRWRWLLLTGLGLGLASLFKYSAALLLPILALLAGWLSWRGRSWRPLWAAGAAAVMAGLLIWLVYGLALQPLPGGAFWEDIFWVIDYFDQPLGAYLLGEISYVGWWYYFPVTYLLKTPLPLLLLLVFTLGLILWQKRVRMGDTAVFLLLPIFLYLLVSLTMSLNIGYRHLLPMLPFIALALVAYLWQDRTIPQSSKEREDFLGSFRIFMVKLPAVVAAVIVVAISLWQWPDYIPYFNLLAGGTDRHWQLLSDSNIDWGQDLPALATWQQETGQSLKLSYFGTAYPSAYGLDFEMLPTWAPGPEQIRPDWQLYNPARPAPGYYAISVTNLHGVVLDEGRDTFAYFRERMPLARIGGSIFIYEVAVNGPPVDMALSGLRPADLEPAIQQQWPGNDWRVRLFDASMSLLWSPEGIWLVRPVAQEPVEPLRSFWPVSPAVTAVSQQLYRIDPPLPDWADQSISFDEVLTLRGVQRLVTDPNRVELLTLWQVERETKRPLQLFIHALDDTGQIAGQWDGLDVVPRFWSAGDLFLQFHTFPVAGSVDVPLLAIGVYDAETGERLGEPLIILDDNAPDGTGNLADGLAQQRP
jgi:hypothetical protein